ncbi:MAG: hypothetical protein IKJ74_06285 [Clostridia bacterium]|nr:hypothetical protein [Clostridia bacterium]
MKKQIWKKILFWVTLGLCFGGTALAVFQLCQGVLPLEFAEYQSCVLTAVAFLVIFLAWSKERSLKVGTVGAMGVSLAYALFSFLTSVFLQVCVFAEDNVTVGDFFGYAWLMLWRSEDAGVFRILHIFVLSFVFLFALDYLAKEWRKLDSLRSLKEKLLDFFTEAVEEEEDDFDLEACLKEPDSGYATLEEAIRAQEAGEDELAVEYFLIRQEKTEENKAAFIAACLASESEDLVELLFENYLKRMTSEEYAPIRAHYLKITEKRLREEKALVAGKIGFLDYYFLEKEGPQSLKTEKD